MTQDSPVEHRAAAEHPREDQVLAKLPASRE
jgi:hypothetical protein